MNRGMIVIGEQTFRFIGLNQPKGYRRGVRRQLFSETALRVSPSAHNCNPKQWHTADDSQYNVQFSN